MFKNTFDKKKFFNELKCNLKKIGHLHTLIFIISKYGGITSKDDSITNCEKNITNWVKNITTWVKNIATWVENSKGLSYCVQIIIDEIIKNNQEKIQQMITDLTHEFKSKKYNLEEDIALFLSEKLKGELQKYIEATISNIKEKGNDIKNRIKNYKSVFLVGAGLSYGSIPLTNELDVILKKVNAKDYNDLQNNQKSNKKSQEFKERFKEICEKASPGIAHKLIALNFPEYIKEIICLNWDNLIEKAYFKEHNKKIKKINKDRIKVKDIKRGRYLWKFHGDVENICYDWIFPNHPGRVFKNFKNYLRNNEYIKKGKFVFVIVGYSEREKNIVNNIIKVLESKAKGTTRIGLNPSKIELGLELEHLHDQNYIFGPADFVLEHILPINSNLF